MKNLVNLPVGSRSIIKKVVILLHLVLFVGLIATTTYLFFNNRTNKHKLWEQGIKIDELDARYSFYDPVKSGLAASFGEISAYFDGVREYQVVDQYGSEGSTSVNYKKVKLSVYKVKVNNNTGFPLTITEYDIQAKVENGILIDSQYVENPPSNERSSLSLAPGGSGEFYVRYPTDQGDIQSLFSRTGSYEIKIQD